MTYHVIIKVLEGGEGEDKQEGHGGRHRGQRRNGRNQLKAKQICFEVGIYERKKVRN